MWLKPLSPLEKLFPEAERDRALRAFTFIEEIQYYQLYDTRLIANSSKNEEILRKRLFDRYRIYAYCQQCLNLVQTFVTIVAYIVSYEPPSCLVIGGVLFTNGKV